jgi:hypothetical protein
MGFWNFLKHASVAGLTGAATSPLEEKIRASQLSDEEKVKYVGAAVGGTIGGVAGYYVGERVGDHSGTYTKKEKLMATGIGALSGALGGYFIGAYIFESRKSANAGQQAQAQTHSEEEAA